MDGWRGSSGIKILWKRFDLRNNCLSFTHGFGVDGYGVSTVQSHTLTSYNKHNDATDCSKSSDVTVQI